MAKNQPRKAPDYKARTAGPGKASARTDLSGNQPLRVPTGLPYGEAGRLRTLQQAISLPEASAPGIQPVPLSGQPEGMGEAVPPTDPRAIVDAVASAPSLNSPEVIHTAREAAIAMEMAFGANGGRMSASAWKMLMELKQRAMMEPRGMGSMNVDPDFEQTVETFGLTPDVDALDDEPFDDDDVPSPGQLNPMAAGDEEIV